MSLKTPAWLGNCLEDLLDAVLKLHDLRKGKAEIAKSKERTVGEMAELLADAMSEYGVKMQIVNGEKRNGDVLRNYSGTTKARVMLGWQATTALEEGLKITANYFCGK